jgi:anti-sigma-K factor RskA
MNTHNDDDRNNLRYAEYVLGVLDADARASVAREITENTEAATAVARWQQHLVPLARTLPDAVPPAHVWSRITQSLRWNDGHRHPARRSLLESLRLWQWVGVGASVLAAACVVIMLRTVTVPTHEIAAHTLMVSSIKQTNGVVGWTATMDLSRKEMIVVPATPAAYAKDRSTLWLIPHGGKPISVGVFKPNDTNVMPLNASLLSQLGPTAVLAISVEPMGGSPTGQPTGPVVAQGQIGAAPDVQTSDKSA